jgi:hypothetical protein
MTSPLRKVLAGSIIITSTGGAGVVAPVPHGNNWSDIRREFENNGTAADVAAELGDILGLYQNAQIDLEMAIRLSYLEVAVEQRAALDSFWTDYLTSEDTSVTFETLIALRDEALGGDGMGQEDILQDWLWKAQGANDYDCVARQGPRKNCGKGNGLDGNNGTPNEGV